MTNSSKTLSGEHRSALGLSVLCSLVIAVSATPLWAQDNEPGRVAESAVGEAGQRQRRDKEVGNIQPMARLNTRIINRVQTRLRNRVDRYYDPQANASSPFVVAEEQLRTTRGRPKRR